MTARFFVEPEGLSGPELWRHTGRPDAATVELVLRKAELPGFGYDELLWRVVTGVLAPDDATAERLGAAILEAETPFLEPSRDTYERMARAVLAALADPDTGGAA